jgi:16S rRNA processing protein RimM
VTGGTLLGQGAFIDIGRVAGLHGIRGKVKVAPLSGDPSGALAAKVVRMAGIRGTEPGTVREYEVVSAHRAGGCAVFSLKGVDSPEDAGALAGARVSMRRDDLPPLPEGEFYWADAVGCAVVDAGGNPLGEVTGVMPGPAYDWLVVRRGGEEAYLPLVAAFVLQVDVAAGRVVAAPPEGW